MGQGEYRLEDRVDFLTRLGNIQAFHCAANGRRTPAGVLLADLKGLRRINNALGHGVGDQYLRCAADALWDSMPRGGAVYRVGGDEFALVAEGGNEALLESLADRVERRFEGLKPDRRANVSLSLGWAAFDLELDSSWLDTARRAWAHLMEECGEKMNLIEREKP